VFFHLRHEEGINGGLSDDVVFSEHHLNNTICRKHHAELIKLNTSTPKNSLGYLKKEESKERNNPMEE
jgi:hypothetical protein